MFLNTSMKYSYFHKIIYNQITESKVKFLKHLCMIYIIRVNPMLEIIFNIMQKQYLHSFPENLKHSKHT